MDEAQLTEFFGGKSLDDRFRNGLNLMLFGASVRRDAV